MKAYVGADWSTKQLVCATATGGEKPRRIHGAEPSLQSVRDLIRRVRERHPDRAVHVCIEAGALAWVKLLQAAGAVVHVVDPKQAKRFSESLRSSGAKSDGADAISLCEMLRSLRHCPDPWHPESEGMEPMLALAGLHERLTQQSTRLLQQLRSSMRAHMPLVDQVLDLTTQWSRRFLEAVPTPWHARELVSEQLEALTKRCSHKKRDQLIAAVEQTEAPWLTESVALAEATAIRVPLAQLELIQSQLADLDRQLDELTGDIPERTTLESVKGIGLKQATALLTFAFGDHDLGHRDEAAIRLGAAPVFVGSGTDQHGRSKGRAIMRRAAHHRARRATYLLGRLAQQNLSWAAAMYQDGRKRGQTAGTAYRRIARSLLRVLTAMIRNNVPYDEERYIAALKSNGVAWAMEL